MRVTLVSLLIALLQNAHTMVSAEVGGPDLDVKAAPVPLVIVCPRICTQMVFSHCLQHLQHGFAAHHIVSTVVTYCSKRG